MPVTDGKAKIVLSATNLDIELAKISTHASRHKSGGADSIKLDELAAPTDINSTTLNATDTTHGLCPRLSGVSTEFLNGIGSWSTVTSTITSVDGGSP